MAGLLRIKDMIDTRENKCLTFVSKRCRVLLFLGCHLLLKEGFSMLGILLFGQDVLDINGTYLFVSLLISLSLHLPVSLSLSLYLSIYLFIYLYLSSNSICSFYLFIYLSIYLSLPFCLSLSLYLSFHLSSHFTFALEHHPSSACFPTPLHSLPFSTVQEKAEPSPALLHLRRGRAGQLQVRRGRRGGGGGGGGGGLGLLCRVGAQQRRRQQDARGQQRVRQPQGGANFDFFFHL